jgi:hypothetical protein
VRPLPGLQPLLRSQHRADSAVPVPAAKAGAASPLPKDATPNPSTLKTELGAGPRDSGGSGRENVAAATEGRCRGSRRPSSGGPAGNRGEVGDRRRLRPGGHRRSRPHPSFSRGSGSRPGPSGDGHAKGAVAGSGSALRSPLVDRPAHVSGAPGNRRVPGDRRSGVCARTTVRARTSDLRRAHDTRNRRAAWAKGRDGGACATLMGAQDERTDEKRGDGESGPGHQPPSDHVAGVPDDAWHLGHGRLGRRAFMVTLREREQELVLPVDPVSGARAQPHQLHARPRARAKVGAGRGTDPGSTVVRARTAGLGQFGAPSARPCTRVGAGLTDSLA